MLEVKPAQTAQTAHMALHNTPTQNTIRAMVKAKDPDLRATTYLSMWFQTAGLTIEHQP